MVIRRLLEQLPNLNVRFWEETPVHPQMKTVKRCDCGQATLPLGACRFAILASIFLIVCFYVLYASYHFQISNFIYNHTKKYFKHKNKPMDSSRLGGWLHSRISLLAIVSISLFK